MAPLGEAAELPLGPRSLDERRSASRVAPGVRWTRIVREGGPWRVNVLSVAPKARVVVAPSGKRMGEPARPSAVSRRPGAVAAVNGGYSGGDGHPVGVLAAGGRLLSEPVGGRSALLLGAPAPARVMALRFDGAAHVGAQSYTLDGVNRTPGEIPACGGRGGDRPTERADAVATCNDTSELVLFTARWGARTPRAPAGAARTDVTLRDGAVSAARARGGTPIPVDGAVLAGTGSAARLLRDDAPPGLPLEVGLGLRGPRSPLADPVPTDIVGGGPRLLAGGRVRVRGSAEGFDPLSAPLFHEYFVSSRHPRTLAGVRADGRLLLVTVDGRQAGWSAGVTLSEAARLMRSLGAREALNLDGGGSTVMAVRGKVVNSPSDPAGERPVSDALLVMP